MSAIPVKINGKQLCEIFTPDIVTGMSDEEKREYSLMNQMYPSEIILNSETYSKNADRTADYELQNLLLVNRKAKIEILWETVKLEYISALLRFLNYTYDFKDASGFVQPVEAEPITVTYVDFVGERSMQAYLGQTLQGTIVEYEGVLYVQDFRIAFPER